MSDKTKVTITVEFESADPVHDSGLVAEFIKDGIPTVLENRLNIRYTTTHPDIGLAVAFRIKSGSTFEDRRYTPPFGSISHLQDSQWFDHLRFIKGSPGPYFLEYSRDDMRTWEELGELGD